MVRGSGDGSGFRSYQSLHFQAHYIIPGSLQPDEAVSHQLKSFRPCSWPLDSWAALLGTGVSWAGGQSPRGGALDKSEECVGLWAVASEEVVVELEGTGQPEGGDRVPTGHLVWASQAEVCSEYGQALIKDDPGRGM